MGSISIKRNGSMRNFDLSYLDWAKAQAANTANSGITDLGDLVYTRENCLCEGTLIAENIPEGATNKFYIFKSDNFPNSLIRGYTPKSEQRGGRVLYFGAFQESGDNINDFFPQAPEDDRPPSNYTVDVTNPEEFKWWSKLGSGYSYYGPVYKTDNTVPEIFLNYNALGYFETMTGCTFGASMDMVGGNQYGVTAGIQIHSYGAYKYLNSNSDRIPTLTGNQAWGGKPWGPKYDGQSIIPYPSNEVAYNAYTRSLRDWSIMPGDVAIADIGDDITAEFVVTSINNSLYAGLAACRWENNRIVTIQVTLLPAWFWGAGSLDTTFDFDIPDYDDTWYGPDSSPNPGNAGGYTVKQQGANIAGVPAASYWTYVTQGTGGVHVYRINGPALAKLQNYLWTDLLTDEGKVYALENIISIHQMPHELMPAVNANNYQNRIAIGAFPVPVPSGGIAQLVDPLVAPFKIGSFKTTAGGDRNGSLDYFNGGNYMDYEPYVAVTLYLPFAGTIQIAPSQCIGGSIEVWATSNAYNGDVVYTIKTTSDGHVLHDANGNPVESTFYASGNSAMAIMVSGTTTGERQKLTDMYNTVGGVVQMGAGVLTGNPGAAFSGLRQVAQSQYDLDHIQLNAINAGGLAGSAGAIGMKQVVLRITRPVKAYDKSWIDLGGIRSEMAGKLSKASGFTRVKFVNTSTLSATDAEKDEVKRLLQGGVYL